MATNINIDGEYQINGVPLSSGGGGGGLHVPIGIVPQNQVFGGTYVANYPMQGGGYGQTMQADQIYYSPFIPFNTFTATECRIWMQSGANANGLARIGIYEHNTSTNLPTNRIYQSADISMSTTGFKTVSLPSFTFNAGTVYWLAFQGNTYGFNMISCASAQSYTIGYITNGTPICQWAQVNSPFANGLPTTTGINTFQTAGPPQFHFR